MNSSPRQPSGTSVGGQKLVHEGESLSVTEAAAKRAAGLGAFLRSRVERGGADSATSGSTRVEAVSVALEQIVVIEPGSPGEINPRSRESEAAQDVLSLTASIRTHGLLQPLIVRPMGHHRYQLIAGHRRFDAVSQLGWTHVPVRVLAVDDVDAMAIALVENEQRANLSVLEQAWSLRRIFDCLVADGRATTQEDLALMVGHSTGWVSQRLAIGERITRELVDNSAATLESAALHRLPEVALTEIVKASTDATMLAKLRRTLARVRNGTAASKAVRRSGRPKAVVAYRKRRGPGGGFTLEVRRDVLLMTAEEAEHLLEILRPIVATLQVQSDAIGEGELMEAGGITSSFRV